MISGRGTKTLHAARPKQTQLLKRCLLRWAIFCVWNMYLSKSTSYLKKKIMSTGFALSDMRSGRGTPLQSGEFASADRGRLMLKAHWCLMESQSFG